MSVCVRHTSIAALESVWQCVCLAIWSIIVAAVVIRWRHLRATLTHRSASTTHRQSFMCTAAASARQPAPRSPCVGAGGWVTRSRQRQCVDSKCTLSATGIVFCCCCCYCITTAVSAVVADLVSNACLHRVAQMSAHLLLALVLFFAFCDFFVGFIFAVFICFFLVHYNFRSRHLICCWPWCWVMLLHWRLSRLEKSLSA